jgi:hydrogenase maturation protease
MDPPLIDKIVNALLYEGYLLYPYRPSVKSRHRWTFGGLYPQAYCEAEKGSDASSMQAECLVRGGQPTTLSVEVRFLHLLERRVGRLREPLKEMPPAREPTFDLVDCLEVGSRHHHPWQEAMERRVPVIGVKLGNGALDLQEQRFAFPASHQLEPIADESGSIMAVLVREQEPVAGSVETSAAQVGDDLFRLRIRIANVAEIEEAACWKREQALLRSLVSTHAVLSVTDGDFVSILDPPEDARTVAAGCRNIGCWPVLIGQNGDRGSMLVSPSILYDYPEVALESPGDLFDATEATKFSASES